MNIGILAFGSLVDDPGDELLKHISNNRKTILTPFNVEYYRSSNSRDGAPTLVPVEGVGSPVKAVILPLIGTTVDKAKNMLYRREINKVNTDRRYVHSESPSINKTIIDEHKNIDGFDVLLSAKLQPSIEVVTPDKLAELAIKSAEGDSIKTDRDGITYLHRNILNGIITPLTKDYTNSILRMLDVSTLEEAITLMKNRNSE